MDKDWKELPIKNNMVCMSAFTQLSAVNYVKNICKARLKPLRVLANNGSGVGIPVLYYGPCILLVLLDQ